MRSPNQRREQNKRDRRWLPASAASKQESQAQPSATRRGQRMLPPLVLAILAGGILLLLLAGAGVAWMAINTSTRSESSRVTDTQASLEAIAAGTPAATQAVIFDGAATATPTIVSDARSAIARCYTDGVEAYGRRDWQLAAAQFQCVYTADQNYQDIQEKLSATYYNWGVQLLSQGNAVAALDKFNTALTIMPNHQLALDQQKRLVLYLDALSAIQQQNWATSVDRLEKLRAIQSDFLDSVALLYNAYLKYGALLERRNQLQTALYVYRRAAALPVEDKSQAKRRIAAVSALLAPTATPIPSPTGQVGVAIADQL
jgi:hypothetical protein